MTASFILEAKEPSPPAHAEKLREEFLRSQKGKGALCCYMFHQPSRGPGAGTHLG